MFGMKIMLGVEDRHNRARVEEPVGRPVHYFVTCLLQNDALYITRGVAG